MSTSTVDYKRLLQEAIDQAKANAARAVDDLLRCASKAAEAVAGVTRGAAALELVPINQDPNARPTYQLQLRKVGSEAPASDLGVYYVTEGGYPVLRWYSRNAWESHPENRGRAVPGRRCVGKQLQVDGLRSNVPACGPRYFLPATGNVVAERDCRAGMRSERKEKWRL